MMAMESDDAKQMIRAVKDVIGSCTEGQVEVDQLTMFDLEYVFTRLRSKSVGETATIGMKCSSCETKNDVDINLDDVRIDNLNPESGNIKLTDNIGVMLKYPSVNDFMSAQQDTDRTELDKIFSLIVACIDKIYAGDEMYSASEQSRQELIEFIESLSSHQFNRIQQFIETMPTTALTVQYTCTNCSHQNETEVRGLANFFS